MTETTPTPTSDERAMGALAHLFGPIVALIVWGSQKDKSPFLRFQAIQAVAFDSMVTLLFAVLATVLFAVIMVGAALAGLAAVSFANINPDQMPLIFILFPFFFITPAVLILPISLVLMAIRLYAAIKVFQGVNFHYPWLGRQVEKFLGV